MTDFEHAQSNPTRDADNIQVVKSKVEALRTRLLDSSRRNPLIQVPFRQNSSSLIRFVDELPDVLADRLGNQRSMRLVALPPIDEPLPDEQTDDFLDALEIARASDDSYLASRAELDPTDKDYEQKDFDLERALKDRIRAELGLPERQTKENPTLSVHARAHGISPSYSLPYPEEAHYDGRHEDGDIQTLLLPDRLDRIGRALHGKGRSFEKETGVNVLHVAFGILEWNNPNNPRSPARSPLLLLEVRMERKKAPSGSEYHIRGEGGLALNTTLAQSLSSQFGIELPPFEGGSVEDYLEEVADLAPKGWHWTIRREALVGVFPSSRIAMYRDLDPSAGSVTESEIAETMLTSVGGDGASYSDVYDTDDPAIWTYVPHLVMDADATQFSALYDVANGENVAIEGPPGSGKSQTIVNLIASALAQGKRVLFVAEKLTALDVVRNRLDAIGLGDFVLPLQAGRGSRDAVFQSLEDRLMLAQPPAGAAETHKQRYASLVKRRDEMQAYLDVLGSKLGASDYTVHDAMALCIASADHLDGLPRDLRRLRIAGAERVDPERRAEIDGDTRMIVDRLAALDQIDALWKLASTAPINGSEAEDIAQDFASLAHDIRLLSEDPAFTAIRKYLPENPVRATRQQSLDPLREIAAHPACDGMLAGHLLDPEMRAAAKTVQDARDVIVNATAALGTLLSDAEYEDIDVTLQDALELAKSLGGDIDLDQIAQNVNALNVQNEGLRAQAKAARALPARWGETADAADMTLADLRLDVERLLRAPQDVLLRRQPDDSRTVPTVAREAAATIEGLTSGLAGIRKDLPGAGRHDRKEIDAVTKAIERAGFFRAFSRSYKAAKTFYVEELEGTPKLAPSMMAGHLRDYAEWADKRDSFTADARMKSTLGSMFDGLDGDPDTLVALATFHETVAQLSQGDERLRYALEAGPLAPLEDFAAMQDMAAMTLSDLDAEIARVEELATESDSILKEATSICAAFSNARHVTIEDINAAMSARNEITAAQDRIDTSSAGHLQSDLEETSAIGEHIELASHIAALPDPQAGVELLESGAEAATRVKAEAEVFFQHREALARRAGDLGKELDLDIDAEDDDGLLIHFAYRLTDIDTAAAHPEGLVDQARLLRAVATLETYGLDRLTDWIRSADGAGHRTALPNIVQALYARSLMDYAGARFHSELDRHDGRDLNRLRADIGQIDKDLLSHSRAAIRDELLRSSHPPVGNGTGKVGTYTQMSMLRHELNKSRNRASVRDLTARAGAALIDLKPCWMMSPLAVAQYLPQTFKFDLVVIDEASQMTPENALGAIMRGNQVVVVGDTKQLPPTNFFAKLLDDSDEAEDDRTDSESILDIANASFSPIRQLQWHYRSRHPALIAVSNKMIYDSALTIFPAARDDDPDLGVELIEVEGQYRKGYNVLEAREIVSGAIRHMREHPDRSLGLATMNKAQAELIMNEFERERARTPHVDAYLDYWAEKEDGLEEFFVKNLETIQGDERDVIMISTVYGPDEATGKVYQRFGPINGVYGHRRLNVLFSRAKEKVVTYTSLKPTDIQTDGKAYGVAVLRSWLEFSRTGQITDVQGARKATDTPFEDFVIAQIEAAGYEAVPQVGASGFRIDIGVRHPDWPYGFILAVECDGAPYHSARSSRDRDRLRQEVLEGLGWRFHRIWSTDWFRDRDRQIEHLRKALDDALARAKADEERRAEMRADARTQAKRAVEAGAHSHGETNGLTGQQDLLI